MARLFFSFTFALATATVVLLGAGATPASAQPATPPFHRPRPNRSSTPRCRRPSTGCSASANMPAAIRKLEEPRGNIPNFPRPTC